MLLKAQPLKHSLSKILGKKTSFSKRPNKKDNLLKGHHRIALELLYETHKKGVHFFALGLLKSCPYSIVHSSHYIVDLSIRC